MKFKFFVEDVPWLGTMRLFIHRHPDVPISGVGVVQPMAITTVAENEYIDTPFIEARRGGDEVTLFLQAALDAAWERDLRPTGFADHANELRATKDHLADMRALVFADGKLWPPLASAANPK